MEASPFGKLPPGLRNRIYEFALPQRAPITTKWHRNPGGVGRLEPSPGHMTSGFPFALVNSCRQIRHETRRLFYELNKVKINASVDDGATYPDYQYILDDLARHAGEDNVAALQSIMFDMGDSRGDDVKSFQAVDHGVCSLRSLSIVSSTTTFGVRARILYGKRSTLILLFKDCLEEGIKAAKRAILQKMSAKDSLTQRSCSTRTIARLEKLQSFLEDLDDFQIELRKLMLANLRLEL